MNVRVSRVCRAFCVLITESLILLIPPLGASIVRLLFFSPHPSEQPTAIYTSVSVINALRSTEGRVNMTLKEQAWQSGLFLSDETAEWNENDWPPLEGGWRRHHATVVIDHPEKELHNDNKGQTVVVLGGVNEEYDTTNSVLVMTLEGENKQWREGPPMNKARDEHTAVVCNGGVYVMGGYNQGSLNCIERIDVKDLLRSSLISSTTQESPWTTLTCRLSTTRNGCCAVAVHNRYIIVLGGYCNHRYLSSVDIIYQQSHCHCWTIHDCSTTMVCQCGHWSPHVCSWRPKQC